MQKFQSLDVGALVLWRAFGLTEKSHTFCFENWQILMNESAFHFYDGRWILTTTVFHIPKASSAGGIPDFFRVWKRREVCPYLTFKKIQRIFVF
jgi:hypothetical protein